jgi:hypothetical protein
MTQVVQGDQHILECSIGRWHAVAALSGLLLHVRLQQASGKHFRHHITRGSRPRPASRLALLLDTSAGMIVGGLRVEKSFLKVYLLI